MTDQNVIQSINPATEELRATFEAAMPEDIDQALSKVRDAFPGLEKGLSGMEVNEEKSIRVHRKKRTGRLIPKFSKKCRRPIFQPQG
jgi:hypothetical protein